MPHNQTQPTFQLCLVDHTTSQSPVALSIDGYQRDENGFRRQRTPDHTKSDATKIFTSRKKALGVHTIWRSFLQLEKLLLARIQPPRRLYSPPPMRAEPRPTEPVPLVFRTTVAPHLLPYRHTSIISKH